MTGTSKALKRLGVTGLSAVIISAGLATVTMEAANAAASTGVTLDKHSDTAAVGTCNPFTATVTPAGSTITVNISQAVPANTAVGGFAIGFCNPVTGSPAESTPATTTAPPGSTGADTTPASPTTSQCKNVNATGASPTAADTVSCNTTYTDSSPAAPNQDGKIVFGVMSSAAGTMTVTAFGDTNGNGQRDVTPAEPGDSATKTWVANSTTSSSNKLACTPTSASNPTSSTHTLKCTVTDANGVPLGNQTINFLVLAGGPDAGAGYQLGASSNATSTPAVPSNATCSTTATGVGGTTPGTATCSYTNNGSPGHDTINLWIEGNGNQGQQGGEPGTSVTKDWIQAAAVGSTVSVSCSPNQTTTVDSASLNSPSGIVGVKPSAICQDPTSNGTETFTATVTNGVPATGQAGLLVAWAITNDTEPAGAPATETAETLSATSCTTDSSGKCSVTLTNAAPNDGESITVRATVARQSGGPTFASGVKNWHNPTPGEARNVSVTPKTSTQPSGGVQTLTAMVTDRLNNAVKNVLLDWSENGPGAFRGGANNAQCTTDATGKCSVDVSSLSTESGDETITVTIDATNYDAAHNPIASGNPNAATPTAECDAPAGNSFFNGGAPSTTNSTPPAAAATAGGGTPGAYAPTGTTSPSAGGGNNTATGAPAGNCSDNTTKVTWQTGAQNGSVQIGSFTNSNPAACSSFTISGTAPSGATVTLTGFNFRQGTFTIGTATAGTNGAWTFTGSGVCFNTTVTASTGSGSGATNSNTVTLGFHQVFINVHFTRVGPYRKGLIEYNVSGSSTSIVGGEPIRVQNGACRSELCGITHMRSNGFDRLHIYLLPGTYNFVLYGTGGSDAAFGGDGHQYLNAGRTTFTVTIH